MLEEEHFGHLDGSLLNVDLNHINENIHIHLWWLLSIDYTYPETFYLHVHLDMNPLHDQYHGNSPNHFAIMALLLGYQGYILQFELKFSILIENIYHVSEDETSSWHTTGAIWENGCI